MPQRAAVQRDAVPDGGRAHAGLRDHEPRQPRARLALHGRRLPGHRGLQPDRLVPGGGGVRARGHAGHRHAGGGDRAPHPLRARPPGPGPRHLRPDPLLQRGRGHRLGARGAVHRGAARAVRPPPGAAGHPVPRLPRGHHPGRPGLPQADAEHRHRPLRRRQRGAGARLDADLHPDGGGALLSPPGAVPGRPQLMRSARALALVAGFLVLGLVPVVAALANQPFYLDLFRRIMIFAVAAVSLDLILGFGGMVSFGHAAYLGIGAYAVAIPAFYGIHSGLVQWPLALALSGPAALAIGAVSLRTSGVSFIMITLAFAQMLYYLCISINAC